MSRMSSLRIRPADARLGLLRLIVKDINARRVDVV